MKNHYITIAVVTVLTFIVNPVHAEGYAEGHACKSIVLTASGLLSPHACDASLLSALKNSGKYPDVFAAAARHGCRQARLVLLWVQSVSQWSPGVVRKSVCSKNG